MNKIDVHVKISNHFNEYFCFVYNSKSSLNNEINLNLEIIVITEQMVYKRYVTFSK